MLAFLHLKFVKLTIDLLFSVSQLGLGTFSSFLTLKHILVVGCQSLQLLHVRLDFCLLSVHFTHLDIELLDSFLHLLALVKQGFFPLH